MRGLPQKSRDRRRGSQITQGDSLRDPGITAGDRPSPKGIASEIQGSLQGIIDDPRRSPVMCVVAVSGLSLLLAAGKSLMSCRLPQGRQGYGQSPYYHDDFRDFDSSIILILRAGIIMSIGNFPESLSQAILVGIILVGRLCVCFPLLRSYWPPGPHR